MESAQNTDMELGGDLDFNIEVGDNTDKPMESMGSGSNALGKPTTSKGKGPKHQVPGAELSEKKKKFVPRFLKGAAHPGYCMLHVGVKLLALFFYIFLGLFLADKTFCFLVVIIVSAIDFWLVKNVTGR